MRPSSGPSSSAPPNDNVFKFAFTVLVTYRLQVEWLPPSATAHPDRGTGDHPCNHVSFVDAVLLMAASPRPIRFVMDHRIFKVPVLGSLFKLAKAIPVAPQREDPVAYAAAFEAADKVLAEGDLLGIFPEGAITRDGQLQPVKPFRRGLFSSVGLVAGSALPAAAVTTVRCRAADRPRTPRATPRNAAARSPRAFRSSG